MAATSKDDLIPEVRNPVSLVEKGWATQIEVAGAFSESARGELSGAGLWILESGLGMRHGRVGFSAESTLKTDPGPRFKATVEPAECMNEL